MSNSSTLNRKRVIDLASTMIGEHVLNKAVQKVRNRLVNLMAVEKIMEMHEQNGIDFIISNGQVGDIKWQNGPQRLSNFLHHVKNFPIYLRSAAIVAGLEDEDVIELLRDSSFEIRNGMIYQKEVVPKCQE